MQFARARVHVETRAIGTSSVPIGPLLMTLSPAFNDLIVAHLARARACSLVSTDPRRRSVSANCQRSLPFLRETRLSGTAREQFHVNETRD